MLQVLHSKVSSWPYPKHSTKLERQVKHSSLVQTFVNYGRKKVYNIGTRL